MIGVVGRTHQPLLFRGKSDKDECVMPRVLGQTVKEAREKRGAGPVVDYTVTKSIDMVRMSADKDDVVRLARHYANHVGRKFAIESLLGKILRFASGLGQPIANDGLAFAILRGKRFQVRFDGLAGFEAI